VIPTRWPVHPGPKEAESLSSWLRRLAMVYGLSLKDLIEHDLGFCRRQQQRHWLDMAPPTKLLTAVAARTGIPLERIQQSTMAALRPVLYAYFDRKFSACSTVLMAQPKPPLHLNLQKWILRHELVNEFTACRRCLDNYPNAAVLLPWRLRIITSCPEHGVMLEAVRITGDTVEWRKDVEELAPALVSRLDLRTWQALTTGSVNLTGGSVPAGLWFRLLRTIWDELNRPLEECHDKAVLAVWTGISRLPSMTKDFWHLRSDRKHAICVGTAIDMLETGATVPEGIDGRYFAGSRRGIINIASFHRGEDPLVIGKT